MTLLVKHAHPTARPALVLAHHVSRAALGTPSAMVIVSLPVRMASTIQLSARAWSVFRVIPPASNALAPTPLNAWLVDATLASTSSTRPALAFRHVLLASSRAAQVTAMFATHPVSPARPLPPSIASHVRSAHLTGPPANAPPPVLPDTMPIRHTTLPLSAVRASSTAPRAPPAATRAHSATADSTCRMAAACSRAPRAPAATASSRFS